MTELTNLLLSRQIFLALGHTGGPKNQANPHRSSVSF